MTPERLREKRTQHVARELLRMQMAVVEQNAVMHSAMLKEQENYMIAVETASREFNAICLALSFTRFV